MTTFENNYRTLIKKILMTGEEKVCRNGQTTSIFGEMIDLGDISKEFPILQGRQMHSKGVLGELSAMLNGASSDAEFKAHGCNYWTQWADKNGHLELDYGNAWLDFNGVNQIDELIKTLKTNPDDRRMIITGWRPDRLDSLSLPCCHYSYQFHTSIMSDGSRKLNMLWNQRSVDTMIGLPSDAIFAAAWLMIIANQVGMTPGNIKMSLGDTHIYEEHWDGASQYLKQSLIPATITPTATLTMPEGKGYRAFRSHMLEINDYFHKGPIKFELKS